MIKVFFRFISLKFDKFSSCCGWRSSNCLFTMNLTKALPRQLPRTPSLPRIGTCRKLHLAPPFLVEDYVPRYLRQQYNVLERKKEESIRHLTQCNICPRYGSHLTITDRRRCNVNRYERVGTCLIGYYHPYSN